jgi:hypothetical protein
MQILLGKAQTAAIIDQAIMVAAAWEHLGRLVGHR